MLQAFFHSWERRLAAVDKNRLVRPFDWGQEWISANGHAAMPQDPQPIVPADARDTLNAWIGDVMADTDAFFTPPPTTDYTLSPPDDNGERLLAWLAAHSGANRPVIVSEPPPIEAPAVPMQDQGGAATDAPAATPPAATGSETGTAPGAPAVPTNQ